MTFQKHMHNLLPLLDDPLSVFELSEAKCLPPALSVSNISLLMTSPSEKLQKAFEIMLKAAIKNNTLRVVSVGEYTQLMMDWEQSRNVQNYTEPAPHDLFPSITMTAVGYGEKDLLPDREDVKLEQRKMFVVHRDDMKKWLQKEKEWPLADDNLLSRWWPQVESERITERSKSSKEVTSDRVSINDLVDALNNDPIYSDNKRSFLFLREIIPENDMPPLVPLGRGEYSLLTVLVWSSYYNPPLKIYLPGQNELIRLEREIAREIAGSRIEYEYRIDEVAPPVKFIDLEIDLEELRDFLIFKELCLPADLYPRDPANCQRQFEIEGSEYQRTFQEEIQFRNLLPKLQEDVIEAVKNRNEQPEKEVVERAVRALDDLNDLLIKHERTEMSQRRSCLSDECLNAIDYIELRCRPQALAKDQELDNFFRLEKDYWQIRYLGTPYSIKQSVGIQYIYNLIQRAYNDEPDIHVADLYYLVHKRPAVEDTELNNLTRKELVKIGLDVSGLGNAGDIMTPEGKKWMKSQVQHLFDQIEEAEKYGQANEVLHLRERKEQIEDYIKKTHGIFGRIRKAADENENIRKAVSKEISRTLDRLGKKKVDKLAVYLDHHLKKGTFCSFRKDPNIDWRIFK